VIAQTIIKQEKIDDEMIDEGNILIIQNLNNNINDFVYNDNNFFKLCVIDSDSSDFEPLVSCSCCNQWTEELISCVCCGRFYHKDCHIPPLAEGLKPNE